jgi:3-deoxy-D-manno-octulosonic-acid transferase
MIFNLKKKDIPIILLNGRITKKTFKNWSILSNFASEIFQKFDLCLSSSSESKKYLKKLGNKKVKLIGNLKYAQSENEKISLDSKLKNFIKIRKTWCASSTHETEEFFCGMIHNKLKKKYKNLLTIIIPRHIERVQNIEENLKKLNLKVHLREPMKKIEKDTDIYIVNSYGKTKSFFNNCKNIFLGGSIVNHGGQNPLEATRFGCNIIHGPNVDNFREIYEFLKKNKISTVVRNQKQMINAIDKFFNKKTSSNTLRKKFNSIGQKILYKTYKEISFFL